MKKILFVMAGLALLTSCQDETLQRVESNAAISFENAFVAKTTRAAADPSTTTASITGFDVYGFMDQPSGQVFTGDDVTLNGGAWSYVNTQYWLAGHDYYFAALAPMNSTNWVLDDSNANTNGVGTVTFTNVAGTEDLLYAAATATTKGQDVNLGDMDPVPFTFNHLLSKVKFTFRNAFTNPNTTVEVTNLKMTAPGKATIDLATTDWWTAPEKWVLDPNAENVTLDFGAVNNGVQANTNIPANTAWESSVERLTFPAVDTQEYTITFDVQMYQGGVAAFVNENGVAAPKAHTVVLNGKAFEMGKAYNLVTELNAMNIDPTAEELYPIEFTVVEVKEWDTTPEEVKVGRNVETADELVAAIEAGGNVVLANNIDLGEANLRVSKNTTIDLNGFDITGGKDYVEGQGLTGSDICAILVNNGAQLTLKGNGTVTGSDYGVYANGGDVTIYGGTYVAGTSAVQVNGEATVNIAGGNFSCTADDKRYVINCIDAAYRAGTAVVNIVGGSFVDFNPADNASEGANTDYVPAGYKVEEANGVYTVVAE